MAYANIAHSGIYAIRNNTNGKIYVGSAVDLKRRFKEHKTMLNAGKHHSEKLQRAWNKYGADAFDFDVIEQIEDKTWLILLEQFWITELRSVERGYNVCPNAGSILGVKRGQETLSKMSAWQKGISRGPMPEEQKRKISEANKGKKHSKESRAKMSESMRGLKKSDDHRRKLAEANKGNRHTEETKRKIGDYWLGRKRGPQSEEAKANRLASFNRTMEARREAMLSSQNCQTADA